MHPRCRPSFRSALSFGVNVEVKRVTISFAIFRPCHVKPLNPGQP